MAADKVVVVACTWLILASLDAATAISYTAERENENVAHWLTVRTFATETSSVHLTRCCRSCVLARSTSNIYVWMLPFSRSCTHWLSQRSYESVSNLIDLSRHVVIATQNEKYECSTGIHFPSFIENG